MTIQTTITSGPNYGDTITYGSTGDTIQGGAYIVDNVGSSSSYDLLIAGNDTIINDTIRSGSCIDTMIGDGVSDLYYVNNSSDVIIETSTNALDIVVTNVNYTLTSNNIERLLVYNPKIIGAVNNNQDNCISAMNTNDTLIAGSGNDTLSVSSSGKDLLIGGSGNDSYLLGLNFSSDTIQPGSGINTIRNNVSYTLSNNIQNLTLTGKNNKGVGNSIANIIMGSSYGHDTLDGGLNSTISDGSTPGDTLEGIAGNDTFIIHNTGDVVFEAVQCVNTIDTYINYTLGATNFENLTIMDTAAGHYAAGDTFGGNTLTGSSFGNDTLDDNQGTNADKLVGIGGNDLFIVNNIADLVTESSTKGTNTVNSTVSFTLGNNLQNLVLGNNNNLIGKGNALNDTITANSGNDTLIAGSGKDLLIGSSGNNTYILGSNPLNDTIIDNSNGIDTVKTSVSYTLASGLQNLTSTVQNIKVTGNTLANIITGSNYGHDTLDGGLNSTITDGSTPGDTLQGIYGNDTFIIHNTGDVVSESGQGINTIGTFINYTLGAANLEYLTIMDTAAGHYVAGETLGGNTLIGNAYGNDTLDDNHGTKADKLICIGGNDLFIVNNKGDLAIESSTKGTNTVNCTVSFTLGSNLQNLVLGTNNNLIGKGNTLNDTITANSGNDTLIAGSGNDLLVDAGTLGGNSLVGSSGNDTLEAGIGNDTLVAGSGKDLLIGNSGNNVYILGSNPLNDTIIDNSNGTDTVLTHVSYTLAPDIQNLILTSNNIKGNGNTLANIISGSNYGHDTLDGGINCTITGGSTPGDILEGIGGNDTFIIHNTGDVVSESGSGINTIDTFINYTLGAANLEYLTIMDTAAGHYAAGNTVGGNTLTGSNFGNDTLDDNHGTKADKLIGIGGNDTFIVNNTGDVVSEKTNTKSTINTVISSVSYSLAPNIENLILTGTSAIIGAGNNLSNIIMANSGCDTLIAGTGDDYLIGGSNNDTYLYKKGNGIVYITDGSGNDTVNFGTGITAGSSGNMIITESGKNLVINFTGDTTDSLIINNWSATSGPNFTFSDGTSESSTQIKNQVSSYTGYMANKAVSATESSGIKDSKLTFNAYGQLSEKVLYSPSGYKAEDDLYTTGTNGTLNKRFSYNSSGAQIDEKIFAPLTSSTALSLTSDLCASDYTAAQNAGFNINSFEPDLATTELVNSTTLYYFKLDDHTLDATNNSSINFSNYQDGFNLSYIKGKEFLNYSYDPINDLLTVRADHVGQTFTDLTYQNYSGEDVNSISIMKFNSSGKMVSDKEYVPVASGTSSTSGEIYDMGRYFCLASNSSATYQNNLEMENINATQVTNSTELQQTIRDYTYVNGELVAENLTNEVVNQDGSVDTSQTVTIQRLAFSQVSASNGIYAGDNKGDIIGDNSGNATLNGGTGNDILIGTSGDVLNGGAGNNNYVFDLVANATNNNNGSGLEVINDSIGTNTVYFGSYVTGQEESNNNQILFSKDTNGNLFVDYGTTAGQSIIEITKASTSTMTFELNDGNNQYYLTDSQVNQLIANEAAFTASTSASSIESSIATLKESNADLMTTIANTWMGH